MLYSLVLIFFSGVPQNSPFQFPVKTDDLLLGTETGEVPSQKGDLQVFSSELKRTHETQKKNGRNEVTL